MLRSTGKRHGLPAALYSGLHLVLCQRVRSALISAGAGGRRRGGLLQRRPRVLLPAVLPAPVAQLLWQVIWQAGLECPMVSHETNRSWLCKGGAALWWGASS